MTFCSVALMRPLSSRVASTPYKSSLTMVVTTSCTIGAPVSLPPHVPRHTSRSRMQSGCDLRQMPSSYELIVKSESTGDLHVGSASPCRQNS